jgi:GNAT superfamily N-acetyltransferase
MSVSVKPVTAARWDDFVTFAGPRGLYSGCWCTYFRRTGSEFEAGCRNQGAGNRQFLSQLTSAGRVPGLLGYADDGQPVGWISVGPRSDFGRILRSPVLKPVADEPEDDDVWSVVCFYIARSARRTGVATALLDAAVSYAFDSGARVLEAYPVDTRGDKRPSTELYTGTLELFARAGFTETFRRSPRRPVVRLAAPRARRTRAKHRSRSSMAS